MEWFPVAFLKTTPEDIFIRRENGEE